MEHPTATFVHQHHLPVKPAPRTGGDLAAIPLRLHDVVETAESHCEAAEHFVSTAMQLTNARTVSFYQFDSDGKSNVLAENYQAGIEIEAEVRQQSVALAAQSIEESTTKLLKHQQLRLIAVPVASPPQHPQAIVALLSLDESEIEPFVIALQMIAAYGTLYWKKFHVQAADREAAITSGVIEIVEQMHRTENRSAAAIVLANQISRLLNCRRVAVGWQRRREQQIELAAISDLPKFDAGSETARQIVAAMNEAVGTGKVCAWPPTSPQQRTAAMMQKAVSEASDNGIAISAPLSALLDEEDESETIGAIHVLAPQSANAVELQNVLKAALPHLAGALRVALRMDSPAKRWKRRLWGDKATARWKMSAIGAMALCGLMLLPVPHRVVCECEIQPKQRRFVVAPHDGILKQTMVDPGDVVQAGALLAVLDEKEIELELSSMIAERDRAAKDRDKQMAAQNVTAMQMADLEVRRKNLQIQLLQHRRDHLEIRSQEAGIVLQGDLENVLGAPVEKGQSLFEVAPLDEVRLDVRVPQHELPYVGEDATLSLRLDAIPGQSLDGQIVTLHPQAEIISDKNVFVAEATLSQTSDQLLRPGMQGTAKINSGLRPLGWVWFHRPWQKLVNWWR